MFLTFVLLVVATTVIVLLMQRNRRRFRHLQDTLADREREKQAVYDFLNRIGERITTRLDLEETLQMVVAFLQDQTGADAAGVFLKSRDEPDTLRCIVVQGMFPPLHRTTATDKVLARRKHLNERVKKDSVKVGEGLIGRVAETGKGMLVSDAARDERVPREASEIIPIRDLILAPLVVRDEVVGVLALVNKRENGPFTESDASIVNAIADQASVTIDLVRLYDLLTEKQRMEQELRLAKEFQEMLLPRQTPELDRITIAGFSRAALEVGGDYYDYITVDEHHIGIAIADVSGKGIPGGLVMASVRATLRAEARGKYSPREVLRNVNAQAFRDTKTSVFITMTYGVLDTRDGTFVFARAGHEPTVCADREHQRVSLHSPNGIALGLVEGDIFDVLEEETISLREHGTVVLYTDGVCEAMDDDKQEYGEDRFHQVLLEHAGEAPRRVIQETVRDIEEFTEGLEQHDDITIVVLQWKDHSAEAQSAAANNPEDATAS